MEEKSREEKETEYREALYRYSEMGDALYKLEKELGYCSDEDEKLRNEFYAALDPAGFFVWGIEEVKHPIREVFNIQVCRKIPIEIEK